MSKPLSLIVIAILLCACTVDENGIRDPVAEAKAQATRIATQTQRDNAELDLSIREQNALTEAETKRAELKLRQTQAEAQAAIDLEMAKAEAAAKQQNMIEQGKVGAQVMGALGFALSGILLLGALALVIWITGYSYSRARNSVLSSGYVQIGVDPLTMLPPPIVITADGWLVDTRSGERARLRDAASINQLKLAATTRNTETAQMSRAAENIAKSTKSAQPADQLPLMSASVPTLEIAGGNE